MYYKYVLSLVSLLLCHSAWATTPVGPLQPGVDFLPTRGVYEVDQTVTLSTTSLCPIIYSLDGSDPSSTYAIPLQIAQSTVVRAKVRCNETLEGTSKTRTHSYILAHRVLQQPFDLGAGWLRNTYNIGSGSEALDYEMDTSVLAAANTTKEGIDALFGLPTLSISMPLADFWSMNDGSAEVACTMELITNTLPLERQVSGDNSVGAGIVGHSHARLKRSFRVKFKAEYGASSWSTDLLRRLEPEFGDGAANKFDRLVLRAGNNRAWSRSWNPDTSTYVRDQFTRSLQLAMSGGRVGVRGVFVHLYINGVYWGLYNPVERPDEAHLSEYFGGSKGEYCSVSHGGTQSSGDDGTACTPYNALFNNLLNQDLSVPSNYDEVRQYVDLESVIDYLLACWSVGTTDWPSNNWWLGMRGGQPGMTPPDRLRFFVWDTEWSLGPTQKGSSSGAWVHPDFRSGDTGGVSVAKLFNALKKNDDFLLLLADRVSLHTSEDGPRRGALTNAAQVDLWDRLCAHVRAGIDGEAMRWGDAVSVGSVKPRTKVAPFDTECAKVRGFLSDNAEQLIAALDAEQYLPTTQPPQFSVQSGEFDGSIDVTVTNPNGGGSVVLVSLDEAVDPRDNTPLTGSTVTVGSSGYIGARCRSGSGELSALAFRRFVLSLAHVQSLLRVSEIHYHPIDSVEMPLLNADLFEFVELYNPSATQALDLTGLHFSDGIEAALGMYGSLAPGARLVLASSPFYFEQRYGVAPSGVFVGSLRNSGETLRVSDALGRTVFVVDYNDRAPWPVQADGGGVSLVLVDEEATMPANNDWSDATLWTASAQVHGTPFQSGAGQAPTGTSGSAITTTTTAATTTTCALGTLACGCGTMCNSGLVCDNGRCNVAPACNEGTAGCGCRASAPRCDADLECDQSTVCAGVPGCTPGEAGCTCAAANECATAALACRRSVCVPCTGELGCACADGNICEIGADCEAQSMLCVIQTTMPPPPPPPSTTSTAGTAANTNSGTGVAQLTAPSGGDDGPLIALGVTLLVAVLCICCWLILLVIVWRRRRRKRDAARANVRTQRDAPVHMHARGSRGNSRRRSVAQSGVSVSRRSNRYSQHSSQPMQGGYELSRAPPRAPAHFGTVRSEPDYNTLRPPPPPPPDDDM